MTMHFRKAAPKRHFGTLLNTLNCIKAWNPGQDLCRATAKVHWDCSKQHSLYWPAKCMSD